MEKAKGFCSAVLEHLKKLHPQNPHKYEKWGRGRPTKEKVETRRLWLEWNQAEFKKHSERVGGFFYELTNSSNDLDVKQYGKVTIKYKARQ
jgi:hypothetical protein